MNFNTSTTNREKANTETTPFSTLLDRMTSILFMTELLRGFALSFEISMKPKATINYPFEKAIYLHVFVENMLYDVIQMEVKDAFPVNYVRLFVQQMPLPSMEHLQ